MTSFDFVKNWNLNTVADTGIGSLLGLIGHFFFNGCFPVIPWMAFVMVGMWIGRRDLSDRSFRKKLLLTGVGAVTIAESLSRVGMYLLSSAQHGLGAENLLPLFQIVSWDSIPLFMISAMGTALGVISLSTILADKCGNSRWIMPHIAAGQVTLSLYVAHIIVGTLFLKTVETLEMELVFFPLWGTIVFYTGAVLFAYYWMRRFGKGPLELLMRRFLVFRGHLKIPSQGITREKDFPIVAG